MRPVILIGYMAVGKTTVGRCLAEELEVPFLDTDLYIEEKCGRKIADIFLAEGESYFRDMETEAIRDLMGKMGNGAVISVGGGLPVREENRRLLKELGLIVYLTASPDTILQRVGLNADRPLLKGGDREKKVKDMLLLRAPLYEAAADVTVCTDGKTSPEVLEEVRAAVEKNS